VALATKDRTNRGKIHKTINYAMTIEEKKTYLNRQFNGPHKTMKDFGITDNEFSDVSGVDGIAIGNMCRDTDLDPGKVMDGIRDIGQIILPFQSQPGAGGKRTQWFDREAVRQAFIKEVGAFGD